jgi:hypothetical protein
VSRLYVGIVTGRRFMFTAADFVWHISVGGLRKNKNNMVKLADEGRMGSESLTKALSSELLSIHLHPVVLSCKPCHLRSQPSPEPEFVKSLS